MKKRGKEQKGEEWEKGRKGRQTTKQKEQMEEENRELNNEKRKMMKDGGEKKPMKSNLTIMSTETGEAKKE
jgi:hypothetical protein